MVKRYAAETLLPALRDQLAGKIQDAWYLEVGEPIKVDVLDGVIFFALMKRRRQCVCNYRTLRVMTARAWLPRPGRFETLNSSTN